MLDSLARFGSIASAALLLSVGAAPARADVDLTLWSDGDSYLKPTVQLDTALFAEGNAWFGKSRENAGDHVGYWGEFGAMPGLEGALALGERGTLRARVSGVWTTTQFGLDAAGSNLDDRHPSDMTLEDAYVGWSSGNLFPSLGQDAIDLSFGSQKYQVGSGFLFWDGGSDGGDRGGYWLGMRKAFQLTGIARLKTGPFTGRVVYVQPNDVPDSSTDVVGMDLEWTFSEGASLGGGYWYFADSDDFRRDGLNVFDTRGEIHPLERVPGLVFSAEVAYERNGSVNNSWGGYGEIGHSFDEVGWKPYLSFRYTGFTGDRGTDDQIEGFDPIYYGFSDWDIWYLGEIFGEYAAPFEVPFATLLSMVEVDPNDPGFQNPTKFVGPVYEKAEADRIAAQKGWAFKQDGAKWRRVVPSPAPKRIFETRPVKWLLEHGTVVICAGGGGIPTMYEPGADRKLIGVEAVVDKDACSELLARELEADLFIMATDAEAVFLDWGTPKQKGIHRANPAAIREHGFPAGSMGPKVEAACQFAVATGRTAAIGALADIPAIVSGEKGTLIDARFDGMTYHR